jgi:DNA-binding response OmpR family regulator
MTEAGRILIADDEDTFLAATSALLTEEGYVCVCAHDAQQAAQALDAQMFDLLIADIRMPGNADLEFIRILPEKAPGMPVILVTGYPTIHSAIRSIQLPVVAYLIKPVDFEELMTMVRSGVEYSRVHHAVESTRQRLGDWASSLQSVQQTMNPRMRVDTPGSMESFLRLTHDNIVQSFTDLLNVSHAMAARSNVQVVCHLANCPKLAMMLEAIESAVKVLEKTKTSFKSKELGDLRRKLEDLLIAERHPQNM